MTKKSRIEAINEILEEDPDLIPNRDILVDPANFEKFLEDKKVETFYPRWESWKFLRSTKFKLSDMALTDKQIIAVTLVIYGNERKKEAAKIMKITPQALEDHIDAGLKKVAYVLKNGHIKSRWITKEMKWPPKRIAKKWKLQFKRKPEFMKKGDK